MRLHVRMLMLSSFIDIYFYFSFSARINFDKFEDERRLACRKYTKICLVIAPFTWLCTELLEIS